MRIRLLYLAPASAKKSPVQFSKSKINDAMYYPSQQRQHGTKSMFKTTQSFTKLCIKPCILPKGKEKKQKKRKGGLAIKTDTERVVRIQHYMSSSFIEACIQIIQYFYAELCQATLYTENHRTTSTDSTSL